MVVIARTVADTITTSDTAEAVPFYFRSGGENLLASDVFITSLTISVSADDTLTLSDLASGNVSRSITETIGLSDTAEAVPYYFRSGGENLLASGVFATSQTLSASADDTLTLSDLASSEILSFVSAVDTLTLNDSAASTISRLVDAANSLALSDASQGLNGLVASSVDALVLFDSASEVAAKGVTSSESLALVDLAVFAANFSKSATDSFSLSDLAGATVAYPVTAASELTLSDTSVVENHLIVEHTLSLSDFADVVNQASDTITLSDEATLVRDGQRSAVDDLEISHAVGFSLIRENTDERFSPFVGASTQANVPLPVDVTQPTLIPGNVSLAFPADSPTTTLELRAPMFGNRDRLSAQRINRPTRGGTLKVFSDPQWPNNHTLVMEFTALTDEQVAAYLDFVAASLGKEIKLTDHEGRDWRGVITEPEEPIVRNGRKNNSASLVFEGELV